MPDQFSDLRSTFEFIVVFGNQPNLNLIATHSHVRLFAIPWTAALQASLSITNSRSLPKLMSIESVMPSNHLILYCPLLLLPSIFPSIRIFSNESDLLIMWPKYWSFSFNISPSNEHQGLISFRIDWSDLLVVQHVYDGSCSVSAWLAHGTQRLSQMHLDACCI